MLPVLVSGLVSGVLAAATSQAAVDPAAAQVQTLYAALLETMKAGPSLGIEGRIRKLRPVIAETFNTAAMSQFAVGARWAAMSPDDRQSIIAALNRYTVRSYAHNFERYSGEALSVDPQVATRGPDKLVRTRIVSKGHDPVSLNYRMRQYDGKWRIIDVYFNAISQLTAQRSDFESALAAGGAPALVRKLDGLTESLR